MIRSTETNAGKCGRIITYSTQCQGYMLTPWDPDADAGPEASCTIMQKEYYTTEEAAWTAAHKDGWSHHTSYGQQFTVCPGCSQALEREAAHQEVEEAAHQFNDNRHTAVTAARKAVRMIAAAAWDEGYRYSETHLECEALAWGSGDTCPGCPTCTPSNPYRDDDLWSDDDDLTHDYQNISQ